MGEKKRLRKEAERAAATPPMNASQAITLMKAGILEAKQAGDTARADGIARDLAVFKLQIQERERQEGRRPSPYGPSSAQLFTRTGTLGPDTALGGV